MLKRHEMKKALERAALTRPLLPDLVCVCVCVCVVSYTHLTLPTKRIV